MENLGYFTIGLTLGAYLVDWFKNREIKKLEKENDKLLMQLHSLSNELEEERRA